MKDLIESAVNKTGQKAIIVGHSMGCPYSYEVMMSQPESWRKQYISRWIAIAPVLAGTPLAIHSMVSESALNFPIVNDYVRHIFLTARDLEEQYYLLPRQQYGDGKTVFYRSNNRTYTYKDFPELLDRMGSAHGRVMIKKADSFVAKTQLRHPGVPSTFMYSLGHKTAAGGIFENDDDIGKKDPKTFYDDGDFVVTEEALTGTGKKWLSDPATANMTELVKVDKANHLTILYKALTKQTVGNYACDS